MKKILIEKLLATNDEEEFRKILSKEFPNWREKRELWDEKVISHCIEIFGFSKQQFENQFKKNFIPIDFFEESEK